ncbi:MAG: preprotein translocase subunit SecE [Erysipelotrichaceae bacterium]|nr:preprotein translocase subunit SecE [Erysipelotrichaceae bacterium]
MFRTIGRYFKGVAYESTKVRWAKPKEVVFTTIKVLLYLVFFGLLFHVLNAVIVKMFEIIGLTM